MTVKEVVEDEEVNSEVYSDFGNAIKKVKKIHDLDIVKEDSKEGTKETLYGGKFQHDHDRRRNFDRSRFRYMEMIGKAVIEDEKFNLEAHSDVKNVIKKVNKKIHDPDIVKEDSREGAEKEKVAATRARRCY